MNGVSNPDQQLAYMTTELCILVDENDNILGGDTKKNCHLMENINNGTALHRAFSIFLFNKECKLLMQQRASSKITFPDCWTNTVCSHPLYNLEHEKIGIQGVKIAAQRKIEHELGIPPSEVPLEQFQCLTRILYKAASNGQWGEHEVDYILFIQCDKVTINPSPDEVRDFKFITSDELEYMMEEAKQGRLQVTPWFHLIYKQFLSNWWTQLKHQIPLSTDSQIHHLS